MKCARCGRELKGDGFRLAGYSFGPVCAKKMGLDQRGKLSFRVKKQEVVSHDEQIELDLDDV